MMLVVFGVIILMWNEHAMANLQCNTNPLVSLEIGDKLGHVLEKFTRSAIDFQVNKNPNN